MPRPSICLCVMVRDEAKTFPRLAESVLPFIDRWIVCDTGSTDGTQDVVREALRNVPGELHEHRWKDFGHNRSRMLNLARGKADYLLLLDADWTLHVEGDALEALAGGIDCYMVPGSHAQQRIEHKVLVRGDKKWKAVGAVHEYVDCLDGFSSAALPGVSWVHHGDGGARAGRQDRDAAALREEIATVSRSTFYLANTLRETGKAQEAAELYLHRARLGGFDEEVCLSLLYAGTIRDDLGLLLRSWATCPWRWEPLYEAAWRLRNLGHPEAVRRLLFGCLTTDEPEVPGGLFVEPWVYIWGVRFEYALALQNTGNSAGAERQYRLLLDMGDAVREDIRGDIERNLAMVTS